MGDERVRKLTCAAKIAHVVLSNCGPLSPSEVASEAYISVPRAQRGIAELADRGLAEPVCGVCEDREEVYALTDEESIADPSA